MSREILDWAWRQDVPPLRKMVLVCLADHANSKKNNVAFPSKQTIANEVNMSPRTVGRHTLKLQKAGYILIDPHYRPNGSQTANTYRFNFKEGVSLSVIPPVPTADTPPRAALESPLYEQYNEQKYNQYNTGEPGQEDSVGTVQDAMDGHGPLKRSEILLKANRDDDGVLRPSGCAYIWRHYRRTTGASGFQPEILSKETSFLKKAHDRLGGANFQTAVWAVMHNWIGYTKFAKEKGGAYQLPQTPKIEFFLKFCAEAVEFAGTQSGTERQDFVQPTAKQSKPLTKPSGTLETTSDTLTHDEVLEINKEFQD